MEEYIDRHVRWRREQGLGVLTAVGEYQILGDQIVDTLQRLVEPAGLDASEAVEVTRRIQALVDTLVRMVVEKYHPEGPP
jgi:hypothetical protein